MGTSTPESDADRLTPTGIDILSDIGPRGAVQGHAAAMARLLESGLVRQLGKKWYVTPRGRRAITALRVRRDGTSAK